MSLLISAKQHVTKYYIIDKYKHVVITQWKQQCIFKNVAIIHFSVVLPFTIMHGAKLQDIR